MDIHTYISSGIIEQYALGTLSQEEASILECVMANNVEVQQAVVDVQKTIEAMAQVQSVAPPVFLKQRIASQLTFSGGNENAAETSTDQKVISITRDSNEISNSGSTINYSSLWAVAASVLLLVSLGWAMYTTNEKNSEIEQLVQQQNDIESQMQYVQQQNEILSNSDQIKLKGVEKYPELLATVYQNTSDEVYLVLENLPLAPADKQYQLWAIVDGAPVDMGMYDQTNPEKLQSMKTVENAQAFAITLEKKGGSATPTMEEMYVIGNVS